MEVEVEKRAGRAAPGRIEKRKPRERAAERKAGRDWDKGAGARIGMD